LRQQASPSELGRLAAPLARVFDALWRRMHWWIAVMAVLYVLSGITVIKPGEVGITLRWGHRLDGVHAPGLMFALPRPIDEVVRVDVKHVSELHIQTLLSPERRNATTLNPTDGGYALTGDHNIVSVDIVVRYQIRDAAEWAFYGPKVEDVVRAEVTAAMVQSIGELGVDHVLSDGRAALIKAGTRRAQAGLDAAHAGLELSALELTRLAAPLALRGDFEAVQSAIIGATTSEKQAQEFAQRTIPQAQADADAAIQRANGDTSTDRARAAGDVAAFLSLDHEYRANPAVMRERLYRDAVDKAIAAATVRWIPPPVGPRYTGLRVSVQSTPASEYRIPDDRGGNDSGSGSGGNKPKDSAGDR
jgi:membrane protease subunit HflK